MSLATLMATLPFLLPNTDILHRLVPYGMDHTHALVIVSNSMGFFRACCISALITALFALFVCLFKPTVRYISSFTISIAAFCYLFSQVVIGVFIPHVALDPSVYIALGLLLGFGSVYLLLTWAFCQTHMDFYQMLRLCLYALLAASVFDGALLIFSSVPAGFLRVMVSAVAVISTLLLYRFTDKNRKSELSGDNWWDVFSVVDVSLIDEKGRFSTRTSRILFFVATPLMVLLLIAGAMDLHHSAFPDELPIELIASVVTVVFILGLLLRQVNADALQASYRMLLPVVGVAVFIVGNFVTRYWHGAFMDLGALIVAMLYAALIASLMATMASRMASLRVPAMSLICLGLAAATLLSYLHVDPALFGAFKLEVMMVILVIVVVLLALTPGAKVWSLAFAGADELAEVLGVDPEEVYVQRCDAISEKFGLTPRESETLRYLGRGHGSAYIAKEFVVAESTVRSHTKSIYRKLGVNSREELLALIESYQIS